jgi:hypothetical protein
MAVMVLMIDRPSAPLSTQARASDTMSVMFGVSLIHSGILVTLRQAATSWPAIFGSVPNSTPPFLMFGQLMFISRTSTPPTSRPTASRPAAHSTYSSKVSPKKLTTEMPAMRARNGAFSVRNRSTPTFSRPIELIMPEAVSHMRGTGLP